MKLHLLVTCLLSCGTLLSAAEKRLQLGPVDLWGRMALLSQFVDEGAARTGDAATQLHISGRFYNFGAHVDGWMSLDNDSDRDVKAGEFVELRGRIDYLYEMPDYLQVIPFLQTSTYPAYDNVDEPVYVGVDGWYLLPVEGMELGAGFAYDAGDKHGYKAFIGLREFYQQAPLDLTLWQMLHYGDKDHHAFLAADPTKDGITTLEVGAEALVPLPWVGTWLTAGIEAYWWAQSDDRHARGNDSLETMFYIGFDWRME